MYEVTEAYRQAIFNSNYQTLVGTLTLINGTSYNLDKSNISQGSASITMQAVTSDTLEFGSAIFGELNIGYRTDESRYMFYNGVIELEYQVTLDDSSVYTIPLGKYTISDAVRTGKSVKFTAYDNISKLSIRYPGTSVAGTPYQLMTLVAKDCDIVLAENESYYNSLPNGTEVISINEDSGCSTYRDILTAIGQMCGAFFQADRSGKITCKQFHTTKDFHMSLGWRYSASISDFVCAYNKLTASGAGGVFTSTKASDIINPIEMIIDNSIPWDTGGTDFLQARTDRLLDYLVSIQYTPSEISTFSNPMFDCGDMIELDTLEGTVINTIITSYTWNFGSAMSISSVGRNPYFADAKQAANNRRGGGSGGSGSAQKVIFHTYTNAKELKVSGRNNQIMSFNYASNKDTMALFNVTMQVNMSDDGYVGFIYRRGTRDIDNIRTYLAKGDNIITLTRYIDSEENEQVSLKIIARTEYYESDIRVLKSQVTGTPIDTTVPTMIIPMEGIRATLQAQGIGAEVLWDGNIDITESIPMVDIIRKPNKIEFMGLRGSVEIGVQIPTPINITHTIPMIDIVSKPNHIDFMNITEEITVTNK